MTVCLVTGASGFLGRPIVGQMQGAGFDTHTVSRRESGIGSTGQSHRLDLLNVTAHTDLIRRLRPSHMVLAAWQTEVGKYWNSNDNQLWAESSIEALKVFTECGGRHAIFLSSCAEYDWSQIEAWGPNIVEAASDEFPQTEYGRCKRSVTRAGFELQSKKNFLFTSCRIFFPISPGDKKGRLVPHLVSCFKQGKAAVVRHPELVRDFIDVRDISRTVLDLIKRECGGVLNVGSGIGTSIGELAGYVASLFNCEDLLQAGMCQEAQAEPRRLVANTDELSARVGFAPMFTPKQSAEDYIALSFGSDLEKGVQ